MTQNNYTIYNASAGSGKTYTLVRDFLSVLMSHNDPSYFRHLIAITFTNKAAFEMKQRVLNTLKCFSKGIKNDLYLDIGVSCNLDNDLVQQRSTKILDAIFADYSNFNITTIDALTHKIIRSFTHEFGISSDFNIELNTNKILQQAIDRVMSQLGNNKHLTQIVLSLALEQADDDKSWDIRKTLFKFSKILLHESDKKKFETIKQTSPKTFKLIEQDMRSDLNRLLKKLKSIGVTAMDILEHNGLSEAEFNRGQLPKFFKTLIANPMKASFDEEGALAKNIKNETNLVKKTQKKSSFEIAHSVLPSLIKLYKKAKPLHQKSCLIMYWLKSLSPITLLAYIYNAIDEIKTEQNILFISDFNELIFEYIKDEPAPFIYEKLGNRFKHFFIDEMQDTSILQWQNLTPLTHNTLAQEEQKDKGSLLLVGDPKQSIYRWRGSYSEQFLALSDKNNLAPFYIDKTVKNLGVNYRSFSNIIDFNNNFYHFVSNTFKSELYTTLYQQTAIQKTNSKTGGYVEINFIQNDFYENLSKTEQIPHKVLETILNLDHNFKYNEICILVRTNNQAQTIAQYLKSNNIEIHSSESLLLSQNQEVLIIIDLLTLCLEPKNQESQFNILYYLYHHYKHKYTDSDLHEFISLGLNQSNFYLFLNQLDIDFSIELFKQMPLYSAIEYLIQTFKLSSSIDLYVITLLEHILDYQNQYGSDLLGFLDFWDENKDKLNINAAEAENAVQIMTYHKSKGLQFPVVIIPFDLNLKELKGDKVWYDFESNEQYHGLSSINIPVNKAFNQTTPKAQELFEELLNQKYLDNINLIYVATTRAVEQLYLITEPPTIYKNETINKDKLSGLITCYLQKLNKWNEKDNSYSFGNSQRIITQQNEKHCTETKPQNYTIKSFTSVSLSNKNLKTSTKNSQLWGSERGKAIDYGNLVHQILSEIDSTDELTNIIYNYKSYGLITDNDIESVTNILTQIVNHPKLSKCFDSQYKVMNEQELYDPNTNQSFIPDRIVFFDNTHIGLYDYKTGSATPKHIKQLVNYQNLLSNMGYQITESYLIYTNQDHITIKSIKE